MDVTCYWNSLLGNLPRFVKLIHEVSRISINCRYQVIRQERESWIKTTNSQKEPSSEARTEQSNYDYTQMWAVKPTSQGMAKVIYHVIGLSIYSGW